MNTKQKYAETAKYDQIFFLPRLAELSPMVLLLQQESRRQLAVDPTMSVIILLQEVKQLL